MLELLRCDSCAKPLGGGALKRGDAIERHGLVICHSCEVLESNGHSLPIAPPAESKAKWKAAQAQIHAAAIAAEADKIHAQKRPNAIPSKRKPLEADSEPLATNAPRHNARDEHHEAPANSALKVVDAMGNEVAASLERGQDGGLVVRLESVNSKSSASSPSRRKPITETAPTAQVTKGGEIRLPKGALRRSTVSRRPDSESSGDREARTRQFTRGSATFVVLLALLSFSIYVAVTSQQELNRQIADNELKEKEAIGGKQASRPPFEWREEAKNIPLIEEGSKPPEVIKEVTLPLVADAELRRELADYEAKIAAPIIAKLKADGLETRLSGLSDAIHHLALDCAPLIRPLLRSQYASEKQLACEALGFLMVFDARAELEAIRQSESEAIEVRHAAGRALSRMDLVSRNNTLDGWTDEELERLAAVLRRQGDNAKSLEIVERAIAARKAQK